MLTKLSYVLQIGQNTKHFLFSLLIWYIFIVKLDVVKVHFFLLENNTKQILTRPKANKSPLYSLQKMGWPPLLKFVSICRIVVWTERRVFWIGINLVVKGCQLGKDLKLKLELFCNNFIHSIIHSFSCSMDKLLLSSWLAIHSNTYLFSRN